MRRRPGRGLRRTAIGPGSEAVGRRPPDRWCGGDGGKTGSGRLNRPGGAHHRIPERARGGLARRSGAQEHGREWSGGTERRVVTVEQYGGRWALRRRPRRWTGCFAGAPGGMMGVPATVRLASMRYKDYVWPHNPRVYTMNISGLWGREGALRALPPQDLGPAQRVMRGEGNSWAKGPTGSLRSWLPYSTPGTGAAGSPGLADLQRLLCGALTPAGAQGGLCGVFLCFLGGIRRTQHRRTGDRGGGEPETGPAASTAGSGGTRCAGETLWGSPGITDSA